MEGEHKEWGSTPGLHSDAPPESGVDVRGALKPSHRVVTTVTSSLIGATGRCTGTKATPGGGGSG